MGFHAWKVSIVFEPYFADLFQSYLWSLLATFIVAVRATSISKLGTGLAGVICVCEKV